VEYGGLALVLKQIPLENRKGFEREVMVSHHLQHPNVVPVSAVFYDGMYGYIEMPLYPDSLRSWLEKGPRPLSDIAPILREVLQGVAYLHDHGVIHRDIKPDNVCLGESLQPVIIDFGISKDKSNLATTTTTVVATGAGTRGYIAPEIFEGGGSSTASDMWSYGAMLHWAALQQEPSADSKARRPAYVAAKLPQSLILLLEALLATAPHCRPSAVDALYNPFFSGLAPQTSGEPQSAMEDQALARSEAKITRLLTSLRSLQATALKNGALEVLLEQGEGRNIVSLVADTMGRHEDTDFLRPWVFRRAVQDGTGNKSYEEVRDFLLTFLQTVMDTRRGLFETHTKGMAGTASGARYLPVAGHRDLGMYRLVGRAMLKGIVDSCPIHAPFASVLYKHILGLEVDVSDAEAFHPAFAVRYRELAATQGIGRLNLTFENLVPDGDKIPVTDANKGDYVQKFLYYELIGQRLEQLNAIRDGFMGRLSISEHLRDFSPNDLIVLTGSTSHIDPGMVVNCLRFSPSEWGRTGASPGFLREQLQNASPTFLRWFLLACTGQAVVPSSAWGLQKGRGAGSTSAIVRVDRSPNVHFSPVEHRMTLPDFSSLEEFILSMKLEMAKIMH